MDFAQLSLLLVIASVFGLVARYLKQPLLVGFLVAGIVIGSVLKGFHFESLDVLGKVGVTLLLFLLGLEIRISDLKSVGKISLITGLGQILFTSFFGFLITTLLGFPLLTAVYVSIALSFSSTIIIVKLLSEKQDLGSLYGKISIGFLLVQDFVAIAILIFLSGLRGDVGFEAYLLLSAKAIGLFVGTGILAKFVLLIVFEKWAASSSELLFIVSMGWALGLASFVSGPLGFSPEIGGFLAGISLSSLPEHLQIASRVKPLRDFFLTLFFLYLGTELTIGGELLMVLPKALFLAIFVLFGNPLIVLTILGFLGYKSRTAFLSGLTVAQISEFSFVLMAMGLTLGHVGQNDVSMIVIVGVITMTTSTYLILKGEKLYNYLKPFLNKFEREKTHEVYSAQSSEFDLKNHIVLVGCDRTGNTLANYFLQKKLPFTVIDYNPEIISSLNKRNMSTIFVDVSDVETLSSAGIENASLLISTAPQLEDNLTLLEYLGTHAQKVPSVIVSRTSREADNLYKAGASYVVIPEQVTGDHLKHMIAYHGIKIKNIEKQGEVARKKLVVV